MKHRILTSARWLDVSVPVYTGMVRWPGDPWTEVSFANDMRKGDDVNLSKLSMGAHTGTHIDAPLHFLPAGRSIDKLSIDAVVGAARVIHIRDRAAIQVEELQEYGIRRGERILLKTINSRRVWKSKRFVRDFVYLTQGAAAYLASRRIRSVGVDCLSVGGFYENGPETHRILLKAGIWIIEGLNLSRARPGDCELVCLPIKLLGREGAPARAIIRYR